MKHFLVYTGLRIGLFALVWVALIGIAAAFGAGQDAYIWLLVGAAVISSALSLKLLDGPRERLAQSVQERAAKASAKLEEIKSSEDVD